MINFDMDKIRIMMNKFNLPVEELKFIEQSQNAGLNQFDTVQCQTVTEFYLAKTIEQSVDRIIKSNESLEKSNDKHNKVIRSLTGALVFIGIVQTLALIIK